MIPLGQFLSAPPAPVVPPDAYHWQTKWMLGGICTVDFLDLLLLLYSVLQVLVQTFVGHAEPSKPQATDVT